MTLPDITTVAIHSDDDGTVDRLSEMLRKVAGVRLVEDGDGRRMSLVDTRIAGAAATVRRLVEGGGTCVAVSNGADVDAVAELLQ
ncbi:MAG: hypothetical protein QOC54_224, partial [Baekduia sp.]|nr:hypothetical protein [Baekduia sp.]